MCEIGEADFIAKVSVKKDPVRRWQFLHEALPVSAPFSASSATRETVSSPQLAIPEIWPYIAIFGGRMSTYSIAQANDQLSRLVDEAVDGKQVTITRHGKPVVELRPAAPAGRPITMKDIEWLRKCRESLPSFDGDAVAEIRAMRDDF
jgi:prevent-host-death family protein